MRKKLSILIPTYNETAEMVKRLLDSIAIQQRIDFDEIEVLVMNDGDENTFDDALFQGYPFDLNYYINDHKGVSGTRNDLLKKAKGEYVAFCDADDAYNGLFSLWVVFREMMVGFDALIGNFIQETKLPNGDFIMTDMPMNQNFVHGKFWKRSFLMNNNIYFNEHSNVHEDYPIMAIARGLTQNIKYCPTPIYAWLWNPNSVCRRDELYLQKTTKNLLMNSSYVLEYFLKRGRNDIVRESAFSMIMDIYYSLNLKKWLETANKDFRDETEGYFKFFYETYHKYADQLDEEKKNQIIAGQKQMHIQQGVLLEDITFKDWMTHILSDDVKPISFEITSNPFVE